MRFTCKAAAQRQLQMFGSINRVPVLRPRYAIPRATDATKQLASINAQTKLLLTNCCGTNCTRNVSSNLSHQIISGAIGHPALGDALNVLYFNACSGVPRRAPTQQLPRPNLRQRLRAPLPIQVTSHAEPLGIMSYPLHAFPSERNA